MSTVAEIEAALPQSSTEQLLRVEQALHQQHRQRGGNPTYDDACDVVINADFIASAEKAVLAYDHKEAGHARHRARWKVGSIS